MAKVAYFSIAQKELFDLIKSNLSLPEDAKILKIDIQPSLINPINDGYQNIVRFIVESEKFTDICEGGLIYRINPEYLRIKEP